MFCALCRRRVFLYRTKLNMTELHGDTKEGPLTRQKRDSQTPGLPLDWYRNTQENEMATLLSMQEFENHGNSPQEVLSGPDRKPRSLKELDIRQAVVEELV